MGVVSLAEPRTSYLIAGKDYDAVVEEIPHLIKVYKNGHVERPPLVSEVAAGYMTDLQVFSGDVVIDKRSGLWARIYVPIRQHNQLQVKKPLVIYFHGGGFCLGSAAWSCYHEFLGKLASQADCVVMSVNYRLAPENCLPAAYEDGVAALEWLTKLKSARSGCKNNSWWSDCCDLSRIFLAGDSAGGNIVHHVMILVAGKSMEPFRQLVGVILMQPFFRSETRSESDNCAIDDTGLTLLASDTFWKLALPQATRAGRDHEWCNFFSRTSPRVDMLSLPPLLVFISEIDILKDGNLSYCAALRKAGKKVDTVICKGVGHAFQVLGNSPQAPTRTTEMLSKISAFVNTYKY